MNSGELKYKMAHNAYFASIVERSSNSRLPVHDQRGVFDIRMKSRKYSRHKKIKNFSPYSCKSK